MALSHDLTTEDGVREYLQQGLYPTCHRVERLSDGVSGFVYRAWQQASTEPATFIVKHVEGYAARSQNWKLDQHRMVGGQRDCARVPTCSYTGRTLSTRP